MKKLILALIALWVGATSMSADSISTDTSVWRPDLSTTIDQALRRSTSRYLQSVDYPKCPALPSTFFMPAVWINYTYETPYEPLALDSIYGPRPERVSMPLIDGDVVRYRNMYLLVQRYMINHLDQVLYNFETLPEPPKRYYAHTDPATMKITVDEYITVDKIEADITPLQVDKRHWMHGMKGSVQFSQAYISPNWYQGGNNNLNMLLNAIYQIKLNPAYHPKLMFENTVQYKLGINSAPEDTLRDYNISEELFQINTKVGIKAARNWYYSLALLLKTQFFHSYKSNTNDLTASFMSPGELNLGLGMTYNYVSEDKRVQFDMSISPLTYNLKTCIDDRINPATFGIKEGHKTANSFGSSAEAKLAWQLARNVTWSSRLFAFSNYEYLQGDWENTFNFAINSYFSTQIQVHLRYDSHSPSIANSQWHLWQMKEILSFGFSYALGLI